MIFVTKPFLPPLDEYQVFIEEVWKRNWLTNNGPLVNELELKLKNHLRVEHLLYVSNGTIALQLAIKALKLKGEVITTPFSYVATTSAILWENCTPIFVDINPTNFCIDVAKIEASITLHTKAILATHVFGYPCDVVTLEEIAKKHNLKVIYDAAHAFGTVFNGKSILNYGDVSTCSFHATKLFHTVEGGCVITKNKELSNQVNLKRQFGHLGDDHFTIGINGKNSELHAAMGLCNLKYIDDILERRKEQWVYYQSGLSQSESIQILNIGNKITYNYAYFPIILKSEQKLYQIIKTLEAKGIFSRRYFYPALNTLPYLNNYQPCPIAVSIANRVICLPLFHELKSQDQQIIINIILKETK